MAEARTQDAGRRRVSGEGRGVVRDFSLLDLGGRAKMGMITPLNKKTDRCILSESRRWTAPSPELPVLKETHHHVFSECVLTFAST